MTLKTRLLAHIRIARIDHWFKNVFVLPGIVVALGMDVDATRHASVWRVLVGLAAVCLIASSNYVINELMDAPFDRLHPTKHRRPVPSGLVHVPIAYVQWILLMVLGMALSLLVSIPFAATMGVLWLMGCIYNLRPLRSKDRPYVDVLSEAVNNPLRMLAGWFTVSVNAIPPATLILSYWMVGSYFMALKRFAEYRELADAAAAAAYRRSFAFYNERRLLVSIMFYGSASMLFFGAFIVRYRLELIVAFPLVALIMAMYLSLAFDPHSAVQEPERLYRQPGLMAAVLLCTFVMSVLLFVDVPALYRIFAPTMPWAVR